ncbi:hypothetical protein IOK49_01050 [Fervidicoccus fontis]|uniref:Uncharacterized protein n=2 Tax=Fervidicoccus fontis TaxID=683846 RepID=I0A2U0_FERFK|nr:hypothetical protein [Fervidicoccus fontis]AFH43297.1 hypothetical protein FFONT_1309 [Fervidicoccus fontis Kam940]MBE9390674.1 hypothetical protein [Fervidicoccus fontis]PMB77599.1 MAG: endonuclease MutS2 [Fervidicoccus fontis]HEW63850.1 hypothetical protein [Fervidicoccus fontis]
MKRISESIKIITDFEKDVEELKSTYEKKFSNLIEVAERNAKMLNEVANAIVISAKKEIDEKLKNESKEVEEEYNKKLKEELAKIEEAKERKFKLAVEEALKSFLGKFDERA